MRRLAALLVVVACAGTSDESDVAPDPQPHAEPVREPVVVAAEQPPAMLPATEDFLLQLDERIVVEEASSGEPREHGMRVFLVPNREVPLVTFSVRIAGGAMEDPEDREGTAALLARLLAKGAGERDAEAFQNAVDFVGGTFSTGASARWLSLEAEFMAADVELALDLLADVLRRPRFDAGEFARERGLARDAIHAARDQPVALMQSYYRAWLFQRHPYARPVGGDETSLKAIEIEDVRGLAEWQLGPDRVSLAVAGDFEPASMRKALQKRFGDWGWATPTAGNVPGVYPKRERRVLLVDKADALQTYFRFGNVGIDWSHPDYPARYLANTILGGRFTSRLNTALRIESGLSYGAGSGFDDTRAGAFSVRSYTATKTSREALELADEVYRRFVGDGITAEELDSARTYIKGQYAPDNVETAEQAAAMILALEFDGLPRAKVDGFFPALDALTLEDVNRVIREHFPSDALSWVVVGRAEVLRDVVAQFGEVTEISIKTPGFGPK